MVPLKLVQREHRPHRHSSPIHSEEVARSMFQQVIVADGVEDSAVEEEPEQALVVEVAQEGGKDVRSLTQHH
eukprot:CAMPEP_0202956560 /NCGR_PEP_ID=MMETSP1396-20130829/1060_1 /ASSEMBLY_ACC=CAM_ASM_000872 /TAXON_ID= /ORGANISM="Pseudokeronopsis sp., Strain Brazil" /LENGTH=71 /DNA_ID=CAMNT_0049673639 /DNA_START=243 /DNA_END=458 /DNA_ORIENTATION=+